VGKIGVICTRIMRFSEQQEMIVGNVLQQFSDIGYKELWLGGSDLAKDDVFAWSDSTPIVKTFWDVNQPQAVPGEFCLPCISPDTSDNWQWWLKLFCSSAAE